MTETKRRGRPPGSRNRAKTTVDPGASTSLPDWTPEMGSQPTPISQAGYVSLSEPTISVVLSVRRAFGDEATEQVVDWPASWRLPQQGEMVHLRSDWGGLVQSLDFDLERSLIVIFLR